MDPPNLPYDLNLDQINRQLAGFDCSLLKSHWANSRFLEVSGHTGDIETISQVKHSLAELVPIEMLKTDIEADLDPFCAVIHLFKPFQDMRSGLENSVTLSFNHPDHAYRNGEILFVNAVSNRRNPGYLYVDFFDREGNVVHMLPSPFRPNNALGYREERFLGEKRKVNEYEKKRSYEILPPFGTHIVTTLFSESPLYEGIRPEVEAITSYLESLEPILLAFPDEHKPAATFTIIKTLDSV